jgi:hypothetical protein
MHFLPRVAAVSIAIGALVTQTFGQSFEHCSAGSDGTFTPHFSVAPSLVVHSDGVMDATRGDIGLPGSAAERAFSFSRTIAAILASAGGDTDEGAREAFVQSMLDTFLPAPSLPLNAAGGVRMPLDERGEAGALKAAAMLDEASPQGMKPLALFNRFDLAPDNWAHCGEYRIVYGRTPAVDVAGRFLLIFEAMIPNPGVGENGCKPVAEFWADLSAPSLSDIELATRLSAFYYDGKTSPDLATPDLLRPVVDFRNYGGDGGRGQVRANAFNPPPWQLREWLIQRTFSTNAPGMPLTFVPVTVKDNPLAELYNDDLAGTAFLAANPAASANLLHGQFLQALTSTIGPRLLSDTTAKHQLLVNELGLYHLGGGTDAVTPDIVLLNTIALGNDDKFNEFQSVSQGLSDAPGLAGTSTLVDQVLDQVGGLTTPFVNPQGGQILLNRARAVTCGGCHMTASRSANGGFDPPGVAIQQKPDGSVLAWPDVAAGGFVQVTETRELSPTLENAFLPFRRYVLSRYLCTAPAIPTPPTEPGEYEPYGDMPESQAVAAKVGPDLVDAAGSGGYFVDDLISEFAAGAGYAPPAPPDADVDSMTSQVNAAIEVLSPEQLAALRQKVSDAIELARSIELQRAGAFVETRRPH